MQKLLVLLPSNRGIFSLCELTMSLSSHQITVSFEESWSSDISPLTWAWAFLQGHRNIWSELRTQAQLGAAVQLCPSLRNKNIHNSLACEEWRIPRAKALLKPLLTRFCIHHSWENYVFLLASLWHHTSWGSLWALWAPTDRDQKNWSPMDIWAWSFLPVHIELVWA